jgi:hypothetical protein
MGPNVLAQGREPLCGEASLWSGGLDIVPTEKSRRWRDGGWMLEEGTLDNSNDKRNQDGFGKSNVAKQHRKKPNTPEVARRRKLNREARWKEQTQKNGQADYGGSSKHCGERSVEKRCCQGDQSGRRNKPETPMLFALKRNV